MCECCNLFPKLCNVFWSRKWYLCRMNMDRIQQYPGKLFLTCIAIVISCIIIPRGSKAQTKYILDSNSVMNLTGTSAVRNWAMSAHTFTGAADFNLSADNQLLSITDFSIQLPVYSLKSDSRETEKGAYKALKADKYQNIVFAFTSAQFKPSGSDHYMILLRGNLSMAGVTRVAVLRMSGSIHADSTISCSGSLPLSFSDFDIQRPSFLMGAMKVNNHMVLNYTLELVKSKHPLE